MFSLFEASLIKCEKIVSKYTVNRYKSRIENNPATKSKNNILYKEKSCWNVKKNHEYAVITFTMPNQYLHYYISTVSFLNEPTSFLN